MRRFTSLTICEARKVLSGKHVTSVSECKARQWPGWLVGLQQKATGREAEAHSHTFTNRRTNSRGGDFKHDMLVKSCRHFSTDDGSKSDDKESISVDEASGAAAAHEQPLGQSDRAGEAPSEPEASVAPPQASGEEPPASAPPGAQEGGGISEASAADAGSSSLNEQAPEAGADAGSAAGASAEGQSADQVPASASLSKERALESGGKTGAQAQPGSPESPSDGSHKEAATLEVQEAGLPQAEATAEAGAEAGAEEDAGMESQGLGQEEAVAKVDLGLIEEDLTPLPRMRRREKYGSYDIRAIEEELDSIPAEESFEHHYDARGMVDKWMGDPTFWGMITEEALQQEPDAGGDPPGEGPILHWQTRLVLGPGGNAWHPANRKVKMSVRVAELSLTKLARERLLALVGPRYNRNNDMLTLTSERHRYREENRKDVYRILLALLDEAELADSLAAEAGERVVAAPPQRAAL
eukprot:jgi/Mesen1/1577/ME000134S00695